LIEGGVAGVVVGEWAANSAQGVVSVAVDVDYADGRGRGGGARDRSVHEAGERGYFRQNVIGESRGIVGDGGGEESFCDGLGRLGVDYC